MIDPLYWMRAVEGAQACQTMSLELARMNPRGSAARREWLESAALDASRKRMYRRFNMRDLGIAA